MVTMIPVIIVTIIPVIMVTIIPVITEKRNLELI